MAESERTQLVVVTGGPGSGKTTLVEALGDLGYATAPEAAIQVIAELIEEMGNEEQKAWRGRHRRAFQLRILERQLALEAELLERRPGIAFLDRSRLDGLAYCRHFGEEPPPELLQAARSCRYDRVLILDTLTDFVLRADSGRTSDREASLAIRDVLEEVYRAHGMDPIRVPELPPDERVSFVQAALELGPPC